MLPVANSPSAIWEDSFKTSSYFSHMSFVQCPEVNHNANCLANLCCDNRFGSSSSMGRKKLLIRDLLNGEAVVSAHSEFEVRLMLDQGNLVLFPFLREEPCSMSPYLVWHSCFLCSFHLKNKQNNKTNKEPQTKSPTKQKPTQ